MIRITMLDGEYKLKFWHKLRKTTGQLRATSVEITFPDGGTHSATVKPRSGEKIVSRAYGRFYAVQRLIDTAESTRFPRAVRVALGQAVPHPGLGK